MKSRTLPILFTGVAIGAAIVTLILWQRNRTRTAEGEAELRRMERRTN